MAAEEFREKTRQTDLRVQRLEEAKWASEADLSRLRDDLTFAAQEFFSSHFEIAVYMLYFFFGRFFKLIFYICVYMFRIFK